MAAGGNADAVKLGPGRIWLAPVGTPEPTDLSTALNAAWLPAGYTEEGSTFTLSPSFEGIEVAEELDVLRQEASGREMSLEFAFAELTARNVQYAFNGGTISTASRTQTGTVTFATADNSATTAANHRLAVGDSIQFGTITGTPGVTAATTYFVKDVLAPNKFTVSSTQGGAVLTISGAGSSVSFSELTDIATIEPPDPGTETRVAILWEAQDGAERWVFRKCIQTGDVAIARRKAPDKATIPVNFMLELPAGKRPFVAIMENPA